MRFFILSFLLLQCLLGASQICDHLDLNFKHEKPKARYIDAAFVVRLQPNDNLNLLKEQFAKAGIPLIEYNQFDNLSSELMSEFCSSIISPYLLTQTLSHLSIYQYCLKHNIKRALILENYAQVTGKIADLQRIIDKVNTQSNGWDLIYTDIDYHNPNTGEWIIPRSKNIPLNREKIDEDISKVSLRYGTAAFVISQSGMKKILRYFHRKKPNLPLDQIFFKIKNLNIYGSNFDIITNRYTTKSEEETTSEAPKQERPFYETGKEFWIDPIELLTYDRFDVMAKFIYATYYLNKYGTDWHIRLYERHLQTWTKCYNTEPLKIGFSDFSSAFNTLLDSLKINKFQDKTPIPVNNLGLACNGAHRTGACLSLGIPVKIIVEEGKGSPSMTSEVFQKHYHLEEKYLDHMAYEYAKLKKNTFIATLFPFGYENKSIVEETLKKYGTIVYEKELWLNDTGALEFIRHVYTGEWWTGSFADNFKHTRAKVKLCFPEALKNKYPVKVYLYECPDEKTARKAKEEVRALCKKGNEVLHINDNHEQTKIIAASVFNANSIEFLNHRKLKHCEKFESLLKNLQTFLSENKINPEMIAVDTSAVMSAHGIRDCSDMDLVHKEPLPTAFSDYEIDAHNDFLTYHTLSLDDLLFNPENHFYYHGIKFIKLDLIKKMKSNRASEKDLNDVKLIDSFHEESKEPSS